jgi:FMN phosphatase YigB (HAD superfamily)
VTFKVVSVDMFRTLVDLGKVESAIWPSLLGAEYSPKLAEECSLHAGNSLFKYLSPGRFVTCKEVFAACFGELFAMKGIGVDSFVAARLWAAQHPLSPAFSDASGFLRAAGERYRLCLASDTDVDMLGPLVEMYAFDHIFTSEQLGCYKAYGDGEFFSAIVGHYGVKPEEILHVGDGVLEIVGAKRAGLVACWLNRNGLNWSNSVSPDFEVPSLSGAMSILSLHCAR